MSDNRRIIYTRPDGGVSIIVPAPGATDEQLMAAVPADATGAEVVTVDDIPTDRTFRDAWCQHDKKCEVDVEKAKGICHNHRRAKRAEEFAPLDVEATIPAKAAQAEAKREQVRQKYATLQEQIDAAKTTEELKALIA